MERATENSCFQRLLIEQRRDAGAGSL